MAEKGEKAEGGDEKGEAGWALKRLAVELVATLTTDRMTLEVARWVEMKKGGRASAHLDHYLAGGGADLEVDLAKVLREDAGVRAKVHSAILADMAKGRSHGTVPVPQPVYENKDWQFAIGSMNVNWSVGPPAGPGRVKLWFRNKYRWHPGEWKRVSQPVHVAAVRLQDKGAADYWMYGETLITPSAAAANPAAGNGQSEALRTYRAGQSEQRAAGGR